MIRYATILVAALLASPTLAQCPGGVCRGPVRSILTVPRKVARPLVTTTVAAATCDCCPTATTSTKQRRVTRTVTWQRTRLWHRIRFVPQRRWR